MQRQVGNAALTRMLEEREATGRPHAHGTVNGHGVPVQRNVGLEIEDSNWHTSGEGGRRLPKGTPVVHRNYFQLQAEDPDNVEMVTDPPGMANRGDYDRMKASMGRLESELISQQYRAGMAGNAARFRANRLEGGVSDAFLLPGARWAPHLQVTAGVPLAGIPTFFERLKREQVNVQTRQADQVDARLRSLLQLPAAATAPSPATVGGSRSDEPSGPEYRAPSRELLGFTALLNHYLFEGANRPHAQFAKAVYAVMARTDFAASFALLEKQEQVSIAEHLTEWVDVMVSSFAYDTAAETYGSPAGPVLGAEIRDAFGEGESTRAGRVTTSREDWLRGMVNGHDLLSTHGREADPSRGDTEQQRLGRDVDVREDAQWRPALNESLTDLRQLMQGLGQLKDRTDSVTYRNSVSNQNRGVPAVIVEVRHTTGVRPGAGGWIPTADGIYDAVEAAIGNAATVREGTGTRTDTVVPEPSVQPNPAIRQDTSREAIIRRARNGVQDLLLKTRKLALRR
ncbi:hypothetical protein GCM10010464_56760 [Pseudonocardia yunnanensis]